MTAKSSVTRVQVVGFMEGVFDQGALTTAALVQCAASAGAPPGVLAVLDRLDDRLFRDVRELWRYLPELPVGEIS